MAFLGYIGSKNRIAKHIISHLSATRKQCLVDVFGGSAAITILSEFPKRVYNDVNGDLVNLFRVMADDDMRYRLLRKLKWTPMSREVFERNYKEFFLPGDNSFRLIENEIDRAHATFYRMKFCFAGNYFDGGFAVSPNNRGNIKELYSYQNTLRTFSKIGRIFKNTLIEHMDFQKIISLYGNKDDCVLFVDPPYFSKNYYVHSMTAVHHEFLASALLDCKAPVVCTFYDCKELRDLYGEDCWRYETVKASKNFNPKSKNKTTRTQETILIKK